jgi:hypothetical protein
VVRQIAYDILAYLSENPDAKDTAEGIAEWWLSDSDQAKPNKALVEESLAELVRLELILERAGAGDQVYYKVNRRKLREISSVLARHWGAGAADA